MQLIQEFSTLIQETWILLRRFLPQVGTWLLLGWLVYNTCLLTSATLGNAYGPLGVIVFVVGVTANVVSVILAIHSLKPGLQTPLRLSAGRRGPLIPRGLPAAVLATERRIDVAILTAGPVLGVYAAWAIIDGMIRDGLLWNAATRTLWGAAEFSIGRAPSDLTFYVILGGVAILLQAALRPLLARWASPWWKLPLIFLEGLWVFAVFFIVLLALRAFQTWLVGRSFYRQILHSWQGFLEWLPDIPLPLGATLPKALQEFSIWLTESFLPGLWQGIALPLVWVAVVAIVFGWRDLRFRGLFSGGEHEGTDGDKDSWTVRIVTLLTGELREKWLPLLLSFRLIWRSGPHVLGAYLILSAFLYVLDWLLRVLLRRLLSSGTLEQVALQSFNLIGVIHHLVIMSISVCLYAATFDRTLAAATGLTTSNDDDAPQTPGEWAPSKAARRGQAVKLQ